MRTDRWLRSISVLVLVAVFVAGVLCGALVARFAPDRPPPPPGPIEVTIHELALDDTQVAKLRAIADRHRAALDAIAKEVQPRVRSVLYAIEDELRPSLTPEQVARLEAWRARRGPVPLP